MEELKEQQTPNHYGSATKTHTITLDNGQKIDIKISGFNVKVISACIVEHERLNGLDHPDTLAAAKRLSEWATKSFV